MGKLVIAPLVFPSHADLHLFTSFGAVIEEFEVRDGLLALFAEKDGMPAKAQFFAPHEVPVYA